MPLKTDTPSLTPHSQIFDTCHAQSARNRLAKSEFYQILQKLRFIYHSKLQRMRTEHLEKI
jgi:hypothetical protein